MNGRTLDVSGLPDTSRSPAALAFWAGAGRCAVLAAGLGATLASWASARLSAAPWPPANVTGPGAFFPMLGLLLLLASLAPAVVADRAAARCRLTRVRWSFLLVPAVGVAALVVRANELRALDFRWDAHLYGSIVSLVYGLHTAALAAATLETAVVGLRLLRKGVLRTELVDVRAAVVSWAFVVAAWVVLAPLLVAGSGAWGGR